MENQEETNKTEAKPTVDATALFNGVSPEMLEALKKLLGLSAPVAKPQAEPEITTVQDAALAGGAYVDVNASDAQYGVVVRLDLCSRIVRVVGDYTVQNGKHAGEKRPYDFVSINCIMRTQVTENGRKRLVERVHSAALQPQVYRALANKACPGDIVRMQGTLMTPHEGEQGFYRVAARGNLAAYDRGRLVNGTVTELIPGPLHCDENRLTKFEDLELMDNHTAESAQQAGSGVVTM